MYIYYALYYNNVYNMYSYILYIEIPRNYRRVGRQKKKTVKLELVFSSRFIQLKKNTKWEWEGTFFSLFNNEWKIPNEFILFNFQNLN